VVRALAGPDSELTALLTGAGQRLGNDLAGWADPVAGESKVGVMLPSLVPTPFACTER
jgi:hypothetical protein